MSVKYRPIIGEEMADNTYLPIIEGLRYNCNAWIKSRTECKTFAVSQNPILALRRYVHACLVARGRGRSLSTAWARVRVLVYYIRVARLCELTCASCEAPCFLALKPVSFSTTAAYLFVFAIWVCNDICLSMCWCSPLPQRWPRISVKGVYWHKFRPVHF